MDNYISTYPLTETRYNANFTALKGSMYCKGTATATYVPPNAATYYSVYFTGGRLNNRMNFSISSGTSLPTYNYSTIDNFTTIDNAWNSRYTYFAAYVNFVPFTTRVTSSNGYVVNYTEERWVDVTVSSVKPGTWSTVTITKSTVYNTYSVKNG